MNLTETLRIAISSLVSNKLRTGLTMLGMIIGVGAVISLMSVGMGAQASITSRINSMGSNLLFVSPGSTSSSGVRSAAGTAATLTYEDAEAIAEEVPQVVTVAPESNYMGQVIAGGNNVNTRITGVTPEYEAVRNWHVSEGEFITQEQQDGASMVVVLGSNVASTLFPDGNSVGQTINIGFMNNTRMQFKVVGVLESKGSQAMGNQDDTILIPLSTMQKKVNVSRTTSGARNVSTINVQVVSEDKTVMSAAVQNIGDLLRERHKVTEDDFTVRSQEDMLETSTQVTGVLTMLLGAIAGISLVVGGIGIMNIMLVSVTERTREIGIRKAVGAKRRDIMTQFLVESVAVSIAGGVIGILIGVGISNLMSGMTLNGSKMQTEVSAASIMMAFGVSSAIGVFFGAYPANRAAGLNPIDALRYE